MLQNGFYQLPIFHQSPRIDSEFEFEKLSSLERIPCATLLIRVEKAPTDRKGVSKSIDTVPEKIRLK